MRVITFRKTKNLFVNKENVILKLADFIYYIIVLLKYGNNCININIEIVDMSFQLLF